MGRGVKFGLSTGNWELGDNDAGGQGITRNPNTKDQDLFSATSFGYSLSSPTPVDEKARQASPEPLSITRNSGSGDSDDGLRVCSSTTKGPSPLVFIHETKAQDREPETSPPSDIVISEPAISFHVENPKLRSRDGTSGSTGYAVDPQSSERAPLNPVSLQMKAKVYFPALPLPATHRIILRKESHLGREHTVWMSREERTQTS